MTARALTLVSVQPDVYCHKDSRNNIGGPHCARCGAGIVDCPDKTLELRWCIFCGFETGSLPLVEIPPGFTKWPDATTFDEARRMSMPGFDPEREMEARP